MVTIEYIIVVIWHSFDQNQNLLMYCDPTDNDSIGQLTNRGTIVTGLAYVGKGYFKVWAQDRTITEILETCAHETAHTNYGLLDPPEDKP